ncbi:MAG: cation:proton antiporter [Crocinitomicaceae bacterium]|nr:cation:proton antiporter [Crocinitomicaceae bacterium]
MDPFVIIIFFSSVIIISFFCNILAKKTNIPSVLMLIGVGLLVQPIISWTHVDIPEFQELEMLKILGNAGLVMIVLEGALDLELTKEKKGMIINSFLVALIALAGSTVAIASIIYWIYGIINPTVQFYDCLIYGIPLSIMSSAIIIPSVGGLSGDKKEFMVYESTFSDILGIMLFYFMVGNEEEAPYSVAAEVVLNIAATVVVSAIVAYGLVYIFQKLRTQVKLFLIIAVLMLMFSLGKLFHLSALLIILAFGLVLRNPSIFFRGPLEKYVDKEKVKPIMHDFHILTLESAFVIRTFFFVLFGMFITLSTLFNWDVLTISVSIVASLYIVRWIVLKAILKTKIRPELWIAPRGLITILLFFGIASHPSHVIADFNPGILLFVILITSLIMSVALILYRGEKVTEVLMPQIPLKILNKDKEDKNDDPDLEKRIEQNVENQNFD